MHSKRSTIQKLLLLFVVFLTACAPKPAEVVTPVGMPDVSVPIEQLNKNMGVSAPKPWNTYKPEDTISIMVRSISQQMIIFRNADTRAFLYDNGKWIELKNKTNFVPPDATYILDPAKGFPYDQGSTAMTVDLPDPTKPAFLRIFVIGYIYENRAKTDKQVASYTDVILYP